MKIFRHYEALPDMAKGSVVVLGNFDGFHKGHQAVIGEAGRLARQMKTNLAVLVLEPHPRQYFNPDQDDFRLTSFRTKAQLMEAFGVDILFVLPFDHTLSHMLAQDFVADILCHHLQTLHVFAGYDYRFGAGRGGGADVLRQMGHQEQFGVTIIDKIMDEDHVYSSTHIRKALQAGDVRHCADQLGHWWQVEGHVIQGDRRGRTLSFPTANLSMAGYIKPRLGVYAVRVKMGAGEETKTEKPALWDGVANLGRRPTFGPDGVMLEVHIFDFDQDIYEAPLQVSFIDFIRDEQKFDGPAALVRQIEQDCLIARKSLKAPQNRHELFPTPRLETGP